MGNKPLMAVRSLRKHFDAESKLFSKAKLLVHAVDEVSFDVEEGDSLGLVGESGCGKTTTGRVIVQLEKPTSGDILFRGKNIAEFSKSEQTNYHREVQMVFQDPYESLNPRMTVFEIITEPLNINGIGTRRQRVERARVFLHQVGISPAETFLSRYPHELSGGQRQRIAIARALVLEPVFLVADEPTSMLDVSVRTGVMELMLKLQEEYKMSYLYITHDLAVARYMCHRIAVMYLGKIVEAGETEDILLDAQHPYTRALLSAVSVPDPRIRRSQPRIKGGISKPINPPPECRFLERCPVATDYCRQNPHPPLVEINEGHLVSCYEATGGV